LAKVSVVPVVMSPLEPQELRPATKEVDVMPSPGLAEGVPFTLSVVGAGEVTEKPAGKVHCARVSPQTGGGGGGVPLTVSVSVAKLPVSTPPTKRWSEVLANVPVAGAVTFTFTVQTLLAATVPFENEIEPAPAAGANVAAPHPLMVPPAGFATTIAPGEVGNASVKLTPEIGAGLGLVIVKVRAETPFTVAGSGLNALAMVRVEGSTIAAKRVDVEKSEL
jgi:hypothetical protein